MSHLNGADCCICYLFPSYCLILFGLVFFKQESEVGTLHSLISFFSAFFPVSCFQVNARFSKRIQAKIKDLLQQMEEGLKTADPHDCSAYTGWTGEKVRIWMKCIC